jgi:ferredoxin
MIVGEQKPIAEIMGLLGDAQKVLIAGCGTCVTVCFAGGEKEVGILASALRMMSKLEEHPMEVDEVTVQRQCEWEYIDPLAERLGEYDAVLSLACGIGVQAMNERFPESITLPGLNTTFMGLPEEQGVWEERCQACGDCILGLTGGICPIVPCAWQLIWERAEKLGRIDNLLEIQPPKDWAKSRDGGPRKIVREDLQLGRETTEAE